MGESQRKRAAIGKTLCICGSGRLAQVCCFTNGFWQKEPARLGLRALSQVGVQDNCYLAELRSCEGGLSSEHLITEAVMRLLAGDGKFAIGGTPWLPEGEFKVVGFNSLTAKCLCRRHNSALHPLDDAALSLFSFLRRAFESETGVVQAVVSGHDIERWLLKTLKAMAVSGNLGSGGERLQGRFSNGIHVDALLDDPGAWPPGTGLYCVMASGETTQNHNRFQLAPMTTESGQLSALWASIMGLNFILMLEPLDLPRSPQMRHAIHRPGALVVSYPSVQNTILLSWIDGRRHRDSLTLTFQSKVEGGPQRADATTSSPD